MEGLSTFDFDLDDDYEWAIYLGVGVAVAIAAVCICLCLLRRSHKLCFKQPEHTDVATSMTPVCPADAALLNTPVIVSDPRSQVREPYVYPPLEDYGPFL